MEDQLDEREKVDVALVRAEHQKQFQALMDYVKSGVGEGYEYRNDVARVVVSSRGAYADVIDLPEEFIGAISSNIMRNFLSDSEARDLVTRVAGTIPFAAAGEAAHFSLFVLYSRRGLVDGKGCFIYEAPGIGHESTGITIGQFRPETVPLFYKFRVDAPFAADLIGTTAGIVFGMANAGDRHLLVTVPLDSGEVTDLGRPTGTVTIH